MELLDRSIRAARWIPHKEPQQTIAEQPTPPIPETSEPPKTPIELVAWPADLLAVPALPSIQNVIRAVARAWPMDYRRIISSERTKEVVTPRHLAIALAKHLTLRSYPAIGRVVGDRDHTTALHAVRKFSAVMEATKAELQPDAPVSAWVEVGMKHTRLLIA